MIKPAIKKPNTILLALICIFIVVEILILRPSNIDSGEQATHGMFNSIEAMVDAQNVKDEVGYTINGFHYTAVEGESKHWELKAIQAVLFEKSRVVQAKTAKIKMFDAVGKITYIEGDEAHYKMGVKDLELIGNVKVTFPDGMWIKTTRAYYAGATGLISSKEPFNGEANPKEGELMHMWGVGFDASKMGPEVNIYNQAHVRLRRLADDEITDVKSDRAKIDRFSKNAFFSMDDKKKFVESFQGTMHVRSRRQEATYDSEASVLKYMTAYEDVLIRETDPKKKGLQYATGQKADFLTKEDKILLSGFPSAYQEHDTLTGELIVIYRKKNLVEVTQANAYHDGISENPSTGATKQ